jgi:hypothetical protein
MVEATCSSETSVITRVAWQQIPEDSILHISFAVILLILCHYDSSPLLSKNMKVRIYTTIILPVVLYACETWSLTVREERKLRVFENRVLRRLFGTKRDGVTGGWRKLHNEELHNLYSSPSIIKIITSRRMRWADMWHEWERRGTCIGYW